MSNGVMNPTFATIRKRQELPFNSLSNASQNYHQPQPTSFQAIRQMKEANRGYQGIGSHRKPLQNQQNTLHNNSEHPWQPSSTRKNLIRVERSSRKGAQGPLYRSPSHAFLETKPLFKKENPVERSLYQLKTSVTKNSHFLNNKTPTLSKVTRSYAAPEEEVNGSFQLGRGLKTEQSDQGSVGGSSKASFNDSLYMPLDVSYEEERLALGDQVTSSMELQRRTSERDSHQLQPDTSYKAMKKSTNFYCSSSYQQEECSFERKSVQSSASSALSINFSNKFRHYKKDQQKNKNHPIKLSDFQLMKQIGSGKYGKVYLAQHRLSGFVCALKSVSKQLIREQNLEQPFTRQVKIQMYLQHPNIVKLYGFFHDADNVYLIMQYCSEGHLLAQIRQHQRFPETQIMEILNNIFEAVSFLHCQGVIHRDLKPQNIVIQNGVYKLCDFGWAAYACGDTRTTFCGTPLYVCPQVLKGEEYNSKADIWGLGIITYELAFGRVPFAILSQQDLLKIIKDPVYFPAWGSTAEQLIPLTRQMLSKNADERPSLNEILTSDVFRRVMDQFDPILKKQIRYLL